MTLLLCFTFILVCLLAVNPPSVADLQSYPSFPAFLQQPDYILDFEEWMPVHKEKKKSQKIKEKMKPNISGFDLFLHIIAHSNSRLIKTDLLWRGVHIAHIHIDTNAHSRVYGGYSFGILSQNDIIRQAA